MTVTDRSPEAPETRAPRCPACGGDVRPLVRVDRQPVFCNVLWPTRDEAIDASVGDLDIVMCTSCALMWNRAFNPDLVGYTGAYENSLAASATFRSYARGLAQRLVRDHSLAGQRVLEIGSGKGDFLAELLRAGVGSAVGYDPAHIPDGDARGVTGITFVSELYPDAPEDFDAGFVCCRHVLEHVPRPTRLVSGLRDAIDGRAVTAYFEVPDGGYMLRHDAIWDLIYEHPWYFTSVALRSLFYRSGFRTLAEGTAFGGQYLWTEVTSVDAPGGLRRGVREPDADLVAVAEGWQARRASVVERWTDVLGRHLDRGRRLALWGSGSKGVTFLNVVPRADEIHAVVDLNPRKHGRFVPGTGQEVVAPAALAGAPVDVIVAANPLYVTEVRQLVSDLGVQAEVVAL